MESSSYEQRIQQEASYWGKVAEEQLDDGVIPDLRRPVKRTKVVNVWDDPEIENIMLGKFRGLLIKKATEVKGRTLDLGCGMGWLSLELARNGMDVDGIDISEKRIQVARNYLKVAPEKGKSFGSVNYVVAWGTLHHIPEIDRLMAQVKKALKPGGNFVALDHIGKQGVGEVISKILWLVLPTDRGYFQKLKLISGRLWRELRSEQASIPDRSPFEDVTGKEMIGVIEKKLTVKGVRQSLCFSASLVPRIRLREPLKYRLIHLLRFLDDELIKMKICEGEYVFIWAKKEKNYP